MAVTLLDSPHDLTLARTILQALSEVTILGEGDFPAAVGCNEDHSADSVSDEHSLALLYSFDSASRSASGGSSSRTGGDSVSSGDTEEQSDKETDLCRLKRMFPSLLERTLINALQHAPGGKVEVAVDELLNRVFIDGGAQDEEVGVSKDLQSPVMWRGVGKSIDGFWVGDGLWAGEAGVCTKGGKRNRRRNGSIVPQEQGGAWRIESSPSRPTLDTSVGNGAVLGSSDPSQGDCVSGTSRWTILQRDVSFLSAALHVPPKKVASAFHACGLDIAETVYRLIEELPPPHLPAERHLPDSEEVEVLRVLKESFPMVDDRVAKSLWRLVVGGLWRTHSSSLPSPTTPISTPVSPITGPIRTGWSVTGRGGLGGGLGGGGWSVTGRGGGHSHSSPRPQAPPSQPEYRQTPEEAESAISNLWTIAAILQNASRHALILPNPTAAPLAGTTGAAGAVGASTGCASGAGTSAPTHRRPSQTRQTITVNPHHTTSSGTHNLATLTTSLRHALSSSAEASRRANSRNNFAAAAAHYSLHARELTDSIRQMQVMRALETVTPLLGEDGDTNGVAVDLHGLRLAEGVRVAREVVEDFFSTPDGELSSRVYYSSVRSQRLIRRRAVVRVITGRGTHSREGRGVLGPGVVQRLKGEGWKGEVGNGWVEVTGKERRR